MKHWSAREDFPLTDASVSNDWHSVPEIIPHILLVKNEIVGYGEVWLDASDGSAELGRLVVAPSLRKQGLEKLLIERLVFIVHENRYREVWVRVLPTNAPALSCYESAGFTRAPDEKAAEFNSGQRFQFFWMRRVP